MTIILNNGLVFKIVHSGSWLRACVCKSQHPQNSRLFTKVYTRQYTYKHTCCITCPVRRAPVIMRPRYVKDNIYYTNYFIGSRNVYYIASTAQSVIWVVDFLCINIHMLPAYKAIRPLRYNTCTNVHGLVWHAARRFNRYPHKRHRVRARTVRS